MLRETDISKARSALFAIDAGCPREEWIRVLAASKAAGVDLDTVDDWSAGAANYGGRRSVESAWRSLREDGGVGAGSLFWFARQAGWREGDAMPAVQRVERRHPVRSEAPRKPPVVSLEQIVSRCEPATDANPYIAAKRGNPAGLLEYRRDAEALRIAGADVRGWLFIPACDMDGALVSGQFVEPKSGGRKLNVPGYSVGGAFVVGELSNFGCCLVVEGIATAWACHQATGCAAVVAFGKGRFLAVSRDLRTRYPDMEIVLVPDVGAEDSAHQAARAVDRIGVVELPASLGANGDAWDFATLHGDAALVKVLDAVKQPPAAEATEPANIMARFLDARDGTHDTHALTEAGNVLRMIDLCRDTLRYVADTKEWLIWHDGAWSRNDTGAVRTIAATLPAKIYEEGGRHIDQAEHFARWARQSQRARTVTDVVAMLSDRPDMRVPAGRCDANPWLVGVDGARTVVDLTDGSVRKAQPADLVTKSLAVSGVGEAHKAVRWLSFLDQVFDGDAELIDWIQRWCGYLLTGSTREQCLVFAHGVGANGKSVLAELLRYILGDYAAPVAVESLMESKRSAGSATPDLAALAGVRVALSTETEDGQALAESAIKAMTAGDAMSVRPLYGQPFTFVPSFKLLMLGNHRPVIKGTDHGIWRRIRLLPFNRVFNGAERDLQLLDKLKAEAHHVAAWMIEGCSKWQAVGLSDVPAAIASSTEQYRADSDVLGQWLSECCRTGANMSERVRDLYASYRRWCEDNGLRPASNVAFGRRLSERGFSEKRTSSDRWRLGVEVVHRA